MKIIFIILSSFFLVSCFKSEKVFSFRGETMGTYYSVKIVSDKLDEEQIKLQIETLLKEVNQVFSTYIETSEVSRFNLHKSYAPFEVTPVMMELITLSNDIHKKSNGLFDPTVGPLVNLWGFGPDGRRKKPTDLDINKVLNNVGLKKISITNNQLTKREKDIYLDFSSIAKGQGVDDLALVIKSRGFKSYLVEIGGEVRAHGKKPDGSLWAIGIEKPSSDRGQTIQKIIHLKDESIATSGSYRNYLKYGESIFSHTINPQTGYPVRHKLVSVSIIHKMCAVADGWATALMAMGHEKGLDLANELGLQAFFLVKEGDEFKEIMSKAFELRR